MQDLSSVVKEATVLQRVSAGESISMSMPDDEAVMLPFDRRLVTQAVTNLVKNAREAIEARQHDEPDRKGQILVEAGIEDDDAVHSRDRQRRRVAEGEPAPADRALYDDAREGHRPWSRHRQAHHGRTWRHASCSRMRRQSSRRPRRAGYRCTSEPCPRNRSALTRLKNRSNATWLRTF